jgi:Protein of unknown function (DUF732)
MPTVPRGLFAVAAVSTSLVVAVPAQADPGTDFLTMVSGLGLNVGETPADVQQTLAAAVAICDVLFYGFTPEVASRQVHYVFPNATPQQAAGFVDAANRSKLCEQDMAPLQPW